MYLFNIEMRTNSGEFMKFCSSTADRKESCVEKKKKTQPFKESFAVVFLISPNISASSKLENSLQEAQLTKVVFSTPKMTYHSAASAYKAQ